MKLRVIHVRCLGIDIGGTFTDFIVINDEGEVFLEKISSTPKDQSLGVRNGLIQLKKNTIISDLNILVHGTTVATNAILERKGVKTALLVTEGFSDVLEIGRQNRSKIYTLFPDRTEPLVPSNLRFGIEERIDSTGKVIIPLNLLQLSNILDEIAKNDVKSVAVSFLFSFFNSNHENRVYEEIKSFMPNLHVSTSNWVLPIFREYERTSTTVLDAYVAPIMQSYFTSFTEKVATEGINIPPLVLLSTGGVTQMKNAAERSVETVLSGLAGGVLGGLYSCRELGMTNALTLDIGGTSTDVAAILKGQVEISSNNEIGTLPLHIPAIAVRTIGAGGGSIARFEHGILRVGPESAGADPGPACYNLGGNLPTVTDANLVQGFLNPNYFAGGTLPIFPDLARKVVQKLSEELDFDSVEQCAAGIIEIFENNIALALRKVSTEKGYDSRNFALVAFGGAGPLSSCSLADRLAMSTVIIPPYPGVWSAYGLITADIRHDLSSSYLKPLLKNDQKSNQILEEAFSSLAHRGIQMCVDDGFAEKDVLIARQLDIRLEGQSHELNVPYYGNLVAASHNFDRAHELAYGYSSPDEPREIVNLRVSAMVHLPKFSLPALKEGNIAINDGFIGTREVYLRGGYREVNIYQKSHLKANNVIIGPAIIEQTDSTTLVDIGWKARVKLDGHLLITKIR
ncbi:MAG: hydantoinase/oxoprolinase family protein [Candidatus Heimdallarchaeota archaeon]|nr:hydantoinase/oxoprolinase family protein [Candidatus Heimdallarchaeota archaeon]